MAQNILNNGLLGEQALVGMVLGGGLLLMVRWVWGEPTWSLGAGLAFGGSHQP